MKRRVIFHAGPTNSGKTYNALRALKEAWTGVYCGPLRLLALEVYESMNLDGTPCSLRTGQEVRETPFASHASCTVEMLSMERVLDVAAGNGNATLAAARHFAEVTSTDYVPSLLERGRARAEAEGLQVTFREADAEALPFADSSFDVVLSTFGVMFTPDQARAAREMLRVCRPGGRIGLANWTPASFIGDLFKVLAYFQLPLPFTGALDGGVPHLLWASEPRLPRARYAAPGRIGARHSEPAVALRPWRCRRPCCAERVSRGRGDAAVNNENPNPHNHRRN